MSPKKVSLRTQVLWSAISMLALLVLILCLRGRTYVAQYPHERHSALFPPELSDPEGHGQQRGVTLRFELTWTTDQDDYSFPSKNQVLVAYSDGAPTLTPRGLFSRLKSVDRRTRLSARDPAYVLVAGKLAGVATSIDQFEIIEQRREGDVLIFDAEFRRAVSCDFTPPPAEAYFALCLPADATLPRAVEIRFRQVRLDWSGEEDVELVPPVLSDVKIDIPEQKTEKSTP